MRIKQIIQLEGLTSKDLVLEWYEGLRSVDVYLGEDILESDVPISRLYKGYISKTSQLEYIKIKIRNHYIIPDSLRVTINAKTISPKWIAPYKDWHRISDWLYFIGVLVLITLFGRINAYGLSMDLTFGFVIATTMLSYAYIVERFKRLKDAFIVLIIFVLLLLLVLILLPIKDFVWVFVLYVTIDLARSVYKLGKEKGKMHSIESKFH